MLALGAFACLPAPGGVAAMYIVYLATYMTLLGTVRQYIGHTRRIDARRHYHSTKPPAWMKPKKEELKFKTLEAGLRTKGDALAAEALHAARAIARAPGLARGGPWVKPELPVGALAEAQAASRVRSFSQLFKMAEENPAGLLAKHLEDLEFVPADPSAARGSSRRGSVARKKKSGKSGCSGHQSRKAQLERGDLHLGTPYLERLRRGKDLALRRAAEQMKRKPRPYASRGRRA